MAWRRFLDRLLRRRAPPRQRDVSDDDLLAPLRKLAQDQGRSLDEVTYDLLADSLTQRSPTPSAGRLWMMLTLREQDVAALVYAGYPTSKIAYQLGVSVETVRSHIRHILSKVHLHSKVELKQALQREGSDRLIRQRLEILLNPPRPPNERG
jgi:DNA-binding NarL/FixJ family response regulator